MIQPLPRLLTLARISWLGITVFFWILWFASLPGFFARVVTNTIPTVVVSGIVQVSPGIFYLAAEAWNLTLPAWAWLNTIVNGLSFLVFSLVAVLIWWQARTWFGWLTAMVLVLGGSYAMGNAVYTAQLSLIALKIWGFGALIWPFFFLWIYLFPDGRMVPRRLFWFFAPLLALFLVLFVLLTAAEFFPQLTGLIQSLAVLTSLGAVLIFSSFIIVLTAQVYRFMRLSTPIERDKTKWFIFGLLLYLVLNSLFDFIGPLPDEVGTLTFLLIPLGIGIAILRHNLWDINLIIRRTLVYGALTVSLALIYFGGVVVLQGLLATLTGESRSEIVTVVTTLAIAGLFTPLRVRIQRDIDKRFYRKKYNAEQALALFAMSARNETDLTVLEEKLNGIVLDTLEPEHSRLWIRPMRKSP